MTASERQVTGITITAERAAIVVKWPDHDESVRLATPERLEPQQHTVAALGTAPRFPVPSLPSAIHRFAAICGSAIPPRLLTDCLQLCIHAGLHT
jgi:hypothetical protein